MEDMPRMLESGPAIPVPHDAIADFCRRWGIATFALFGSVLREDFRPDSDVDVMVTFQDGVSHEWDEWDAMQDELRRIFGRDVDLVHREHIEKSINWYRRRHILRTARVIHGA